MANIARFEIYKNRIGNWTACVDFRSWDKDELAHFTEFSYQFENITFRVNWYSDNKPSLPGETEFNHSCAGIQQVEKAAKAMRKIEKACERMRLRQGMPANVGQCFFQVASGMKLDGILINGRLFSLVDAIATINYIVKEKLEN
jgi:hypothetical protein